MSSRREGRESDSRRHRSRFDREPSPKRSRREGRQDRDRFAPGGNMENGDNKGRDHKHRSNDSLPLETPSSRKVETKPVSIDAERKHSAQNEGSKPTSEPSVEPLSRSHYQHDKLGSAGQVGRSSSHRETKDRGWWKDSKHSPNEKAETTTHSRDLRDERSLAKTDNEALKTDGNSDKKEDQQPITTRRPAFREKKVPVVGGNDNATATARPDHLDRRDERSERREERFGNCHSLDRREKHYAGNQTYYRGESRRDGFSSRGRYSGGDGGYVSHSGRDRLNGRQVYQPSGARPEKWKHDLFQELDKDPTPKNEEDQIAKLEALLAL